MPIGAIPKNSSVTLKPVNEKTRYISPQYENGSGYLKTVENNSLYQVTEIKGTDDSSDSADLQALAKNSNLVVQQADLTTDSATCSGSGSTTNCTLNKDVPAYKTGSFNLIEWFLGLFGLGSKNTSAPATKGTEVSESVAMAEAMTEKIERTNKTLNPKGSELCDEKNFPAALQNDRTLNCGLKQALEALKKNKDKVKDDVFIFNDFSNGAIMTKAYNPPRGGNIRDGIELVGLEPENQDIHSRGVLLHGWDPSTPTQGCLGVAGSLDTRARGKATLGSAPPYLDQLKKGVLKDGGTMIYNFTPSKAKACQGS